MTSPALSRIPLAATWGCLALLAIAAPAGEPPDGLDDLTAPFRTAGRLARELLPAAVALLALADRHAARRLRHPAFVLLGVHCIVAAISSVFGIAPGESLSDLRTGLAVHTLIIAGVILSLRDGRALRAGLALMATLALGAAVTGAVAFHLYVASPLRHGWLAERGLVFVHRETYVAALGLFDNYAQFARFLLYGLIAQGLLMSLTPPRTGRVSLAAAAAVTAWALWLTTARTCWVALLAGTLVLGALGVRRLLAVAVIAVLAAAALAPPTSLERAATLADPEQWRDPRRSIYARAFGAQAVIAILAERPLLGLGYGKDRFAEAYEVYGSPAHQDALSDAHSNLLQVAAESGLLGAATHAAWAAVLFVTSWRRWRGASDAAQRRLMATVLAAQVALHVCGLGYYMWKGPLALTLSILIGIITLLSLPEQDEGRPESGAVS